MQYTHIQHHSLDCAEVLPLCSCLIAAYAYPTAPFFATRVMVRPLPYLRVPPPCLYTGGGRSSSSTLTRCLL